MFFFKWLGKVINDLIYAARNDPPTRDEIVFGSTLTEIRESREQVQTVIRFHELGLKTQARDRALQIPIKSVEDRVNLGRLLEAIGIGVKPPAGRSADDADADEAFATAREEALTLIGQGAYLRAVSKARDHLHLDLIPRIADAAIAAGALKDLQVMYTDPALAELLGPGRRAHLAR